MHMNPAVEILHSKDLVNWELAGYCTNKLDFGPTYRLEGGDIYGLGIWAPCIRYHNGMFYIFSNVNGAGLQVFRSKSIFGPWEHNQLPGRHDWRRISEHSTPTPLTDNSSSRLAQGWVRGIISIRSTASMSMCPRCLAVP
jgi:hypothetical protein